MVKEELIKRSPVRLFMGAISGGLKAGEIGVISSRNGIGKTSVLVQIALDKLLQGKKVIHVSFTQHSDYVLSWYEEIFKEFVTKKNLENAAAVKDDLVKNRVLMNFAQDGVTHDVILPSIKAMIQEGGFKADALIIDGFDFARTNVERMTKVKDFARELNLAVWYSCTVKGNIDDSASYDKRQIPLVLRDYMDLIDVAVVLTPKSDHIALSVSKDRGVYTPAIKPIKLDPKTLLIRE
jgi:hypothetical protein